MSHYAVLGGLTLKPPKLHAVVDLASPELRYVSYHETLREARAEAERLNRAA